LGRFCRTNEEGGASFLKGCTLDDPCDIKECERKCAESVTCTGYEFSFRERNDRITCELHTTSVDAAEGEAFEKERCFAKVITTSSPTIEATDPPSIAPTDLILEPIDFTYLGRFCRTNEEGGASFLKGCTLDDPCDIKECERKCAESVTCTGYEFSFRERNDRITCELHTTSVDAADGEDFEKDRCFAKGITTSSPSSTPIPSPGSGLASTLIPIMAVVLLGFVCVFCCIYKKKKRQARDSKTNTASPKFFPPVVQQDQDNSTQSIASIAGPIQAQASFTKNAPSPTEERKINFEDPLKPPMPPVATEVAQEQEAFGEKDSVVAAVSCLLDGIENQANVLGSTLVTPIQTSIKALIPKGREVVTSNSSSSLDRTAIGQLDAELVEIADKLGLIPKPADSSTDVAGNDIAQSIVLCRVACITLLDKIRNVETILSKLSTEERPDPTDSKIEPVKPDKKEIDLIFVDKFREAFGNPSQDGDNLDCQLMETNNSEGSESSRSLPTAVCVNNEKFVSGSEDSGVMFDNMNGMEKDQALETMLRTSGINNRVQRALDTYCKHILRNKPGGDSQIPFEELSFGGRIGSGSFGSVVKGKWKTTPVAVKILMDSERQGISTSVMGTFIAELERWKHLRHPHVVQLLGNSIDQTNFRAAFVMELCDTSLFSYLHIDELLINLDVICRIVRHVSAAMNYVHRRGIIHRDLKPANVLLNLDDSRVALVAKVCDFGVSQVKTGTTHRTSTEGSGAGTPTFMAPEQLQVPARLSSKTDVYSIGVMLWEMVERREAWSEAPNMLTLSTSVLNGIRPAFSARSAEYPESMRDIIKQCWHQERHCRPSAAQLYQQISAFSTTNIEKVRPPDPKNVTFAEMF